MKKCPFLPQVNEMLKEASHEDIIEVQNNYDNKVKNGNNILHTIYMHVNRFES